MSEVAVDEIPTESSGFERQFESWKDQIKSGEKVAIFTHRSPDPDAIGSTMALMWLLDKFGIEAEAFFVGAVSHPQNLAMCNLLSPLSRPVEDYDSSEFAHNVMLDCCPDGDNAGLPKDKPKFDLVVDHHKAIPNNGFSGTFINLKNGSCSSTIYALIKASSFDFQDDNAADSKVATSLMVGVLTDTDGLLADSCTEYEFNAYSGLFQFTNDNALRAIIKYKRPKFWVTKKADATKTATIDDDGVAIVGVGLLPEKHFNLIADIADEMISWASVETAVCFAIINGERLVGSVRSINASVDTDLICSRLGGRFGSGGGREGKGSYSFSIQGLSIEEEDDEEVKSAVWATANTKEIKRVKRILNS